MWHIPNIPGIPHVPLGCTPEHGISVISWKFMAFSRRVEEEIVGISGWDIGGLTFGYDIVEESI